MTTTPDRWAMVERLYHAALARSVDERPAFLTEACVGDDELQREVESLLAQDASGDAVLTRGAAVAAAGLVSDVGRSVLTGRRLGTYQILGPIGAGGMGEVYRARDTKLGRDVAIKILPSEFTSHPERLARFQREARVLASLNHPHIGAIYGIEDGPCEAGPHVHALVLELVEGQTLAERIVRGAVPLAEALAIARQIANALDVAHEKGIIHRDLKPANIKITPDTVVKVLDFGLAKAAAGDGSSPDLTHSPTMTIGGTRDGVILGTAAYMSPEQARGFAVDKRTDIWAFGCVLYEMLTGRAAFARETISDTIAAILDREPDWTALPAGTPAPIEHLLRYCLEKSSGRRLRDIGDAISNLDRSEGSATVDKAGGAFADIQQRRRNLRVAAAFVLGAVLASLLTWRVKQAPEPVALRPVHLSIPLPKGQALAQRALAWSPDGSQLVFGATEAGVTRLWLRRLADVDATELRGTEGGDYPFFSPDGAWVGFFADGKLMKVPVTGGNPQTIAEGGATLYADGGSWAADNIIYFAGGRPSTIWKVRSDGGTPEPVTKLDHDRGEVLHRLPLVLPDGKSLLFSAWIGPGWDERHVIGQRLDTGTRQLVVQASNGMAYATGYLIYSRAGTLMAVGFDPKRLQSSGPPMLLFDRLREPWKSRCSVSA